MCLPPSKSISNRVLLITALSGGLSRVRNLSDCDDTKAMLDALNTMPPVVDVGASGTAMRFLTAYLCVRGGEHVITGTERMRHRPIRVLAEALGYLGADITYEGAEGYPPLRIKGGGIKGGRVEMRGDVSSQYISALLMIAPVLEGGIELTLTGDIISRPYIDLTLCVMRDFGADAEWTGNDTIRVEPHPYRQCDFSVESDWSAASYWYEAMALCPDDEAEIRLSGLSDGSRQGDSAVKYLFNLLGVKTIFKTKDEDCSCPVTIRHMAGRVSHIEYDFSNQPDMVPTLVVSCAMLGVPFRFSGLQSLRIKETDRIKALKTEMRKLGFVLRENGGGVLEWEGTRCRPVETPVIDTYDDHRMAMAFAPASLLLPRLGVNDPKVVSKSYPRFWGDLRAAGFKITEAD